jgi:hypothetical protein
MTAGKNPKPRVRDGRNIIAMLKKRGPIVTQQYYSYDVVNVCLRRGNHKKRKIIQPKRCPVNRPPAFGFCPGLRIAGHELKITADAGT